ncbi:putative phosphoenolpyruvate synthase [Vanessa atalanta]|uniref:putative phosphoenolpyruvate synthase n=1 Tax=Vanessa atalanta TaxID=42275 RepID=UPI001FCD5183|nr:putative phosphoenolpyruvate synthase [Vanessa atalanta]
MDLIDILLQAGLFTAAVVVYLIFIRKSSNRRGFYREPGWNYPLKLILARYAVKRWKSQLPKNNLYETPRPNQTEGCDEISLRASAPDGSAVLLGIRKLCGRKPIAEVTVHIKLADGSCYKLLEHPQTAVSEWVPMDKGWSAGGLKIQVTKHLDHLRIIYNGILRRTEDNKTQHVKFNLLWASATSVVQHPKDWSEQLAAETLSLERWRDGNWSKLLNSCGKGSGSWMQWGALQGRFQSFNADGVIERNEYLRLRGVRERSWALSYKEIRRTITVTVAARDGTAVQIRGVSYHNNFTQCISGSVRLPNFMVKSVTSSDLIMSDFCENANGIPNTYTINVSTTNDRNLKVILRINKDEGRFISGPDQHEIVYRTVNVSINGEHGTGILELGYETLAPNPVNHLKPLPVLKCLTEKEAGEAGHCASFEESAAFCTNYVGGKGASLALLASVQTEEGYRVPPGFCITTKAFNKHLEANPDLKKAISEIEADNDNYEETKFKEKCEKAYNLFISTAIVEDVKDSILIYLSELKKKATAQNLGDKLRFAVRSSAVGEDSEALSAAGQNDTILGCVSDDDVLRGVQRCWASMFAFTSAYYRRQNGQVCECAGGVVVQVLVAPRTAGVMFTAHPQQGDPTRLLLTANYGLGESVVSGSVEPDTVIVRRELDGTLSIAQLNLGSKTHKVTTSENGVTTTNVSEHEKNMPCLSESEIFRLARLGISQEKLWGVARDIEWAIYNDDIFLLQARPITSLERWTEEELLHELDFPIMADDELVTFANTGEVLPKPLTALSYDVVFSPLEKGVSSLIRTNGDGYDKNIIVTHGRCALASYNAVYRRVPKKMDVNIRMLEMAIHGHKVADEEIFNTALQRRRPQLTDKLFVIFDMLKTLTTSKWVMDETIKSVNVMNLNVDTDDPIVLLDTIIGVEGDMYQYMKNHGSTSCASTFSQFIAMTVLLEGKSDFTPEECNEISTLLSSGDVLSAEVPNELDKLVRKLDKLGRLQEFREQNPQNALTWLKNNVPRVYNDVCNFLDQHGHRAIMEFDLSTKPWSLVPEDLMKVLMQMRPSKGDVQQKISDDIIASLKTPKKSSTRSVLRWVVPLCHRAVRHREATKAHLILAVHKLRLATRRLARLLERRWLLPRADLIYYFRVHELREYVATRDPVLLRKAIQRHQFYPSWCKLKFSEIHKGWPKPLTFEGPKITTGEVKLKATSVCGGDVIARACVIRDLSEISTLQQGDVLITHSTDIGWSPYFPLLSGIITELGGLISHGAVIAREYGLPCIVGATNATELFKTGDKIRLSGFEGVVEKVSVLDEAESNTKKV